MKPDEETPDYLAHKADLHLLKLAAIFALLGIGFLLLLFGGCAAPKGTRPWRHGWPIPRLTYVDPGTPVPPGMIYAGPISMTGSMRYYIWGSEYVYAEPYYTGMELHLGDVIDNGERLHMIVDMTETEVLTASTGPDAHHFDQWFPKSRIRFVVRLITKHPRQRQA